MECNLSTHSFISAVVDCSCMFRLSQSNHHQGKYLLLCTSSTWPDDGYFVVAKTCNCRLQLLYQSRVLTDYILLLGIRLSRLL